MKTHEIIEMFDSNPNMTLKELSRRSGWRVQHLKELLMSEPSDTDAVAAYVAEGLGEW
jgi:hypothetical protein